MDNLRDGDGGEGGAGGPLPEGAVATHEADGVVPPKDGHGKVEGRDDPHESDRVPLFHQHVARPWWVIRAYHYNGCCYH